jgi:hypothetical protein
MCNPSCTVTGAWRVAAALVVLSISVVSRDSDTSGSSTADPHPCVHVHDKCSPADQGLPTVRFGGICFRDRDAVQCGLPCTGFEPIIDTSSGPQGLRGGVIYGLAREVT